MNGSGLSVVISQPDAALYIQLPMFANTVAAHSTEKVEWRKGLHGEMLLGTDEGGAELLFKLFASVSTDPEKFNRRVRHAGPAEPSAKSNGGNDIVAESYRSVLGRDGSIAPMQSARPEVANLQRGRSH